MGFIFREAVPDEASTVGSLVVRLTHEICERTETPYFVIGYEETAERFERFLEEGRYAAIIGYSESVAIAVATILKPMRFMLAERWELSKSSMWRRNFDPRESGHSYFFKFEIIAQSMAGLVWSFALLRCLSLTGL